MTENLVSRTVTLSEETIRWVEAAVRDYDPLKATTAENTPEKLACWAIASQLGLDPFERLAQTLHGLHADGRSGPPFDPWCPYCGADAFVSGCEEGHCRG